MRNATARKARLTGWRGATIEGLQHCADLAHFHYSLPVDRSLTLSLLKQNKAELARRFAVRELSLFGSTARGTARADSDVDVLVSLDGPANSERYFGVQFYLEDLLGCSVDLVTDKALRAELRPFIERDRLHV